MWSLICTAVFDQARAGKLHRRTTHAPTQPLLIPALDQLQQLRLLITVHCAVSTRFPGACAERRTYESRSTGQKRLKIRVVLSTNASEFDHCPDLLS